jgi:hypothetical protein
MPTYPQSLIAVPRPAKLSHPRGCHSHTKPHHTSNVCRGISYRRGEHHPVLQPSNRQKRQSSRTVYSQVAQPACSAQHIVYSQSMCRSRSRIIFFETTFYVILACAQRRVLYFAVFTPAVGHTAAMQCRCPADCLWTSHRWETREHVAADSCHTTALKLKPQGITYSTSGLKTMHFNALSVTEFRKLRTCPVAA